MVLWTGQEIKSEEKIVVNSTEQNSSSAAGSNLVRIEIPLFLRKLKFHYVVHLKPTMEYVLSHLNPVQTLITYSSIINFNVILPPALRFPT
jgi:hypothetical protein